jgi:hypothetical protein
MSRYFYLLGNRKFSKQDADSEGQEKNPETPREKWMANLMVNGFTCKECPLNHIAN